MLDRYGRVMASLRESDERRLARGPFGFPFLGVLAVVVRPFLARS